MGYKIHFFQVQIDGQNAKGKEQILRMKLCAVLERTNQSFTLITGDCLHDFASAPNEIENLPQSPEPEEQKQIEKWLKVTVQKKLNRRSTKKSTARNGYSARLFRKSHGCSH